MITLTKVGMASNTPTREYVCDTASDVANLPSNVPAGSAALVIATGDVYVCNSQGTWIKLGG